MSVIRTVFLGTPEIAAFCLQSMLRDEHFSIVGVVSQPDRPAGRKMQLQASPVKGLALEHKLPVITPQSVNTPEVLEQLKAWKAEVAVVVAFGQILGKGFLELFQHKVVNVHASLLPRWRGAAPIQRAIMAGDKETGVSLQVVVKKLDAGAVLGERRLNIEDDMDALALHEALKKPAADLLEVELMDFLRGNLSPKPQDESKVTLAPKLDKKESEIDWSQPARGVFNLIRGMALGPGAHTRREGKVLKLHKTQVVDCKQPASPGTVVALDGDSATVACGTQALKLLEVQPESRSRMSMREYMRGYPLTVGERFGSK